MRASAQLDEGRQTVKQKAAQKEGEVAFDLGDVISEVVV